MRILQIHRQNKQEDNQPMSYETFYQTYYSKVLKYLTAKCGRPSDAEDLTSQVFLYCYQNYENYDPDKASIASWVYMVANSRFKNYCRDRRSFVNIDDIVEFVPDERDTLDSAMMIDDMREGIARALLKLSEEQRMIVVLRYFRDMGPKEIAEKLGMSYANVRTQLSRALDKMERELEDLR